MHEDVIGAVGVAALLHRFPTPRQPLPVIDEPVGALRRIDAATMHVRVTQSVFPQAFVIPLSETMTITQFHMPVDDTHTYWYSIFTSFADPIDKEAMRRPRLAVVDLPGYIPKSGRHNDWGFDPEDQRSRTFLGMGEDDINVHDQWAVESMGAIQDRTREHLGTSDKVIISQAHSWAASGAIGIEKRKKP